MFNAPVADTTSQIKSLWPPNPPQSKSVWSLPSTGVDFGFQNENLFNTNQRTNVNGANNVNSFNGLNMGNNMGNMGNNMGNSMGNSMGSGMGSNNMGSNNMGSSNMGSNSMANMNLGNLNMNNLGNLNNFPYEFTPLFPQESDPSMRAMNSSSAFRRNENHNIDLQFYPPKF